jgi:hypothetical protein
VATIRQSGPASGPRPPRRENEVRPIGMLAVDRLAEIDAALRDNLGP